jgi:hypothetical protein
MDQLTSEPDYCAAGFLSDRIRSGRFPGPASPFDIASGVIAGNLAAFAGDDDLGADLNHRSSPVPADIGQTRRPPAPSRPGKRMHRTGCRGRLAALRHFRDDLALSAGGFAENTACFSSGVRLPSWPSFSVSNARPARRKAATRIRMTSLTASAAGDPVVVAFSALRTRRTPVVACHLGSRMSKAKGCVRPRSRVDPDRRCRRWRDDRCPQPGRSDPQCPFANARVGTLQPPPWR